MQGLAARHSPDVRLPLLHVLTGVAAALLGGLVLLWRGPGLLRAPVGNFRTLALTHLFTLGWLAMTITGASYQLVPVVLETRLYSERLARTGYAALAAGAGLLVAGFWTSRLLLLLPGALLASAALLLYAAHIAVTAWRAPGARLHRRFFLAASGYLVLVCLMGGLMAANFRWSILPAYLLPAHVIAAALGWATLLAMGVAYKLTPMFALSHGRGGHAAAAVFVLAAGGTLLLFSGAVLAWPGRALALAGTVPAAAVALFLRDQWRFFRSRQRPRLDPGLRLAAAGFGYLALTTAWGWAALAGALRGGVTALLALVLLGWLGCLVAGQTYKIVPFLVWFHRYAARAGREPVPLLRDMYDERLAAVGVWGLAGAGLLVAGGVAAGTAALVRAGAAAWLGGYGLLAYNLVQVLRA